MPQPKVEIDTPEPLLDEREAAIRMVAEEIAEANKWSPGYALREVRRVCGADRDPITALDALLYRKGKAPVDVDTGKPMDLTNRRARRAAGVGRGNRKMGTARPKP